MMFEGCVSSCPLVLRLIREHGERNAHSYDKIKRAVLWKHLISPLVRFVAWKTLTPTATCMSVRIARTNGRSVRRIQRRALLWCAMSTAMSSIAATPSW